jgi:HNH endonuclease
VDERTRQEVHERSGGFCEAGKIGVCKVNAEHVHHKMLRSQGGTDDLDNLLDVCNRCHTWIHGHPAKAVALGWLSKPWQKKLGGD